MTDLVITISADDRLVALIDPNIRYTSEKKSIDNVIKLFTFLASGKPRSTSCKLTGISIHTVAKWAREEWYYEAIELIKDKLDEALDSTLTAVAHKAADETLERLTNGDEVFDKRGSLVRKKVSARDAMMVSAIAQDKRNLLRGKPTSISETVSEGDRLNRLADKFKRIAIGDAVEAEFEEVEDALSEVSEEGETNL